MHNLSSLRVANREGFRLAFLQNFIKLKSTSNGKKTQSLQQNLQKKIKKSHFFEKILAQNKNSHYLCTRKTAITAMHLKKSGVVVQLVRIPACHAGGRGFESRPYRRGERRMSNRKLCFVTHSFFVYPFLSQKRKNKYTFWEY